GGGRVDKQYLNKLYYDLRDKTKQSRSVAGIHLQVKAKLKKGTTTKPKVSWMVIRENSDDNAAIHDPVFTEDIVGETEHWLRLTVAPVTGARYEVALALDDEIVQVVKTFETWRRIYLDVESPRAALVNQFKKALPIVKKAFREAFVDVVLNRVKVGE